MTLCQSTRGGRSQRLSYPDLIYTLKRKDCSRVYYTYGNWVIPHVLRNSAVSLVIYQSKLAGREGDTKGYSLQSKPEVV